MAGYVILLSKDNQQYSNPASQKGEGQVYIMTGSKQIQIMTILSHKQHMYTLKYPMATTGGGKQVLVTNLLTKATCPLRFEKYVWNAITIQKHTDHY